MVLVSKPATRLGVTAIDPRELTERYERNLRLLEVEDLASLPENVGRLSWYDFAYSAMSAACMTAKVYYLEGAWQKCDEWCHKAGNAVLCYLTGEWMEKQPHDDGSIDAAAWFEKQPSMTWVIYLTDGLAWSAVGRHWDVVDRLLQFPQRAIVADDDGAVPRAYYLGLARWWKDSTDVAWIDEVKRTRGAGSKGYHLLCDIVAGMAAADKSSLEKSFPKYVQYFLDRRQHEEQFPIAATFLWNVAKRDGLSIELPEEIAKFLFEIPQE